MMIDATSLKFGNWKSIMWCRQTALPELGFHFMQLNVAGGFLVRQGSEIHYGRRYDIVIFDNIYSGKKRMLELEEFCEKYKVIRSFYIQETPFFALSDYTVYDDQKHLVYRFKTYDEASMAIEVLENESFHPFIKDSE